MFKLRTLTHQHLIHFSKYFFFSLPTFFLCRCTMFYDCFSLRLTFLLLPCYPETGLSLNLKYNLLGRLAGSQALETHLSPPLQAGVISTCDHAWLFNKGSEDLNWGTARVLTHWANLLAPVFLNFNSHIYLFPLLGLFMKSLTSQGHQSIPYLELTFVCHMTPNIISHVPSWPLSFPFFKQMIFLPICVWVSPPGPCFPSGGHVIIWWTYYSNVIIVLNFRKICENVHLHSLAIDLFVLISFTRILQRTTFGFALLLLIKALSFALPMSTLLLFALLCWSS